MRPPIAPVSLIDQHRQRLNSIVGLSPWVTETSQDAAICANVILQNEIIEVRVAIRDDCFHDNPLVSRAPNICIYAGRPLVAGGMPAGTLCMIDQVPVSSTNSSVADPFAWVAPLNGCWKPIDCAR